MLVIVGEMPRRVIAFALFPLAAIVNVIVQAKGFPYHYHPLTAGVHLQWLVFAIWLGERARVARRDRALVRLVPLVAGSVLAFRVATAMEDSPHIRALWPLWEGLTASERETQSYFAHFPEVDFFPYELRETASYLRAHTRPGDRIQLYGMDPYLLFLAQRLSATPYIYVYDLDADAALAGGTGAHPDEEQALRIQGIRSAHEVDLLARVEAQPPAAFVFLDNSPLMTEASAWDDFETHCPNAADFVSREYRETVQFAHNHVWLRRDLQETALPDDAPNRGSDPP